MRTEVSILMDLFTFVCLSSSTRLRATFDLCAFGHPTPVPSSAASSSRSFRRLRWTRCQHTQPHMHTRIKEAQLTPPQAWIDTFILGGRSHRFELALNVGCSQTARFVFAPVLRTFSDSQKQFRKGSLESVLCDAEAEAPCVKGDSLAFFTVVSVMHIWTMLTFLPYSSHLSLAPYRLNLLHPELEDDGSEENSRCLCQIQH